MIQTEWMTDHGTYPIYSKEQAGALRRQAVDRVWRTPLALVRLGLQATKGELYGEDVRVLLCRPVGKNKRKFRRFAHAVTHHDLWEHGKKPILCAEAMDIRPSSSPYGSWVLRLVHRMYHDPHMIHFSELNELLMRIDAVPLESYVQQPPGPIEQLADEVCDTRTHLSEVARMIDAVDYGELHLGHTMEPDPLQPGGQTLRQVRAPPARFHRLFARGVLHKTRDWKDALIQAYRAAGQG